MFSTLVNNSQANISILEKFIRFNEDCINSADLADRSKMKIYSASSCLTYLYSIFEHFIITCISDYLDAIPELEAFNDLEDEFKNEYRKGISHILNKIDTHRYDHLRHDIIIKQYHDAIFDNSPYQFVTEALTLHESNLRFEVIQSLFLKIRLKDFDSWLAHNPDIKDLYPGENPSQLENLKTELRDFIHLRNDAAHGHLDNLVDNTQLLRFCELIKGIILAIRSYLHRCLLLKKFERQKMERVGYVSEVFHKNGAFIVKLAIGKELIIGQTIHLLGNIYCFSTVINSLQLDDEDVPRALSQSDDFEVGVKCNRQARINSEIYISL